jgi:RimJ/RimL family protein N-acetyltransferase
MAEPETRLHRRPAAARLPRVPVPPVPDFSVKPTLAGARATLRPFIEADEPALLAALADSEALRLTGSVHDGETPTTPPDLNKFRQWYRSRSAQRDRLDLAVVDNATGQCVGEAVLNDWDEGNRSCSFRILLGAAGRDRGLGTEAVRLIVGYGFEQLGLHRITLEVYSSFNPRARHVYDKAGFVAEGVLREALSYGGEWIDATVMSILDHEWARHRGRP